MPTPVVCQTNELKVGPTLPTADGFPYLVMELFRENVIPSTLSDSGLMIDGRHICASKCLEEAYNSEKDCFSTNQIAIEDTDARVYTERWKLARHVVVIQPKPVQIYFARSLNHPHYSVHPLEYAITVYESIWDLKGEVARGKEGMKGQRHQPFANRKASRVVVHQSFIVFYSNEEKNENKKEPCAVCWRLNEFTGAFMSVGVSGEPYKKSKYVFCLT
jgi:hypothetical protein